MRIAPPLLTALLAMGLGPATAQEPTPHDNPYCEDLWFARNLIFDRGGYCFSSALGRATFDNAGCSTSSPALSPALGAQVATIRAEEAAYGCNIDTRRSTLTYPDELNAFRTLRDIPIRNVEASGCGGYRGAPQMLHSGAGADTPVIGQIMPGMSIVWAHWPQNGWTYVTVHPDDFTDSFVNVQFGWIPFTNDMPPCDGYAG
jgi:hypothetical protein